MDHVVEHRSHDGGFTLLAGKMRARSFGPIIALTPNAVSARLRRP